MNSFQRMIYDVFNVPDFVDYAIINSKKISVILYEDNTNSVYSEYGFDDGQTMNFTCKKCDYTPKKGDVVTLKNKEYKVDSFVLDSFGLSYIVTIKNKNGR